MIIPSLTYCKTYEPQDKLIKHTFQKAESLIDLPYLRTNTEHFQEHHRLLDQQQLQKESLYPIV